MAEPFGGGKAEKQHLLPVQKIVLKILTLMAQVQLQRPHSRKALKKHFNLSRCNGATGIKGTAQVPGG